MSRNRHVGRPYGYSFVTWAETLPRYPPRDRRQAGQPSHGGSRFNQSAGPAPPLPAHLLNRAHSRLAYQEATHEPRPSDLFPRSDDMVGPLPLDFGLGLGPLSISLPCRVPTVSSLFPHMQPQPLSAQAPPACPTKSALASNFCTLSTPFLHPPARHPPACFRSSETSGESPCGQSQWSSPHDLNDIPTFARALGCGKPVPHRSPLSITTLPTPPCHLPPAIAHAIRVPSFHGPSLTRPYRDSILTAHTTPARPMAGSQPRTRSLHHLHLPFRWEHGDGRVLERAREEPSVPPWT